MKYFIKKCFDSKLTIRGACNTPIRKKACEDAIVEIQTNPTLALAVRTIGVKNYASFGDQREDHEYGYGPKHGTIVFEISRRVNRIEPLGSEDIALILLAISNPDKPVFEILKNLTSTKEQLVKAEQAVNDLKVDEDFSTYFPEDK